MQQPCPSVTSSHECPIRARARRVATLVAVAILAVITAANAQITNPLPRDDPEDHGVDSAALADAIAAAGDLGYVLSFVVVRDGHVLGEDHWILPAGIPFQSRSVTKSVTSTLIGIAIERGYIDGPWARMVDYLPAEYVPADPAKHEIRIQHLLNMTSGFAWDEAAQVVEWLYSDDPLAYALDRPLATPPGTVFNYDTASSHLLSVILTEATGMSTEEFAVEVLFGPLGITDYLWRTCGGYNNGGHDLFLHTEDMAKLGITFLDRGRYDGQQIVSNYWVNRSTYADVHGLGDSGALLDMGYGWLWWLGTARGYPVHTAIGWGGQLVFCVPALNLVVAVHSNTSGIDEQQASAHVRAIEGVIIDRVIPAVTDRRVFRVSGRAVPELAAIDDMIENLMVEHDIHTSQIALVKDGRLVLAHGYTWDEADAEQIEPTTTFRISSISDAITSIAVHQLIEEGHLSYDTPVAATLGMESPPGQEADPRLAQVTVDHLLTHTAGWDRNESGFDPMVYQEETIAGALGTETPPTRDEIVTFMAGQPMQFDPGTSWAFGNFDYLLLELLAERASSRDFVELVLDNVYRRVGVSRARLGRTLEEELAPGETVYEGLVQGDPYRVDQENLFAGGSQVMAAPDLARVLSALFDSDDASGLLDQETLGHMLELPFPISQAIDYGRGWHGEGFMDLTDHTVGWLSDPDDGEVLYGHMGAGPGAEGFAVWNSQGVVLVWLCSKDPVVENLDDLPRIETWPDHDLWSEVGIASGPVDSAPTSAWIPVVAHADGAQGSVWRSDLAVVNRSTLSNEVRLSLPTESGWRSLELELAAGEMRAVSDVMAELGEVGLSPLWIASSEPMWLSSRTYSEDGLSTYGQYLEARCATCGLSSGDQAVLMQLREDASFRSNIGILNPWLRPAVIRVELFNGDGSEVVAFDQTVPPRQTVQLNRPFLERGGCSDEASGYAVLTVLFGREVMAYASVVDNATNDPTTIPMKSPAGATRLLVAAAAHSEGAHDSVWRTDLGLLNLSGESAVVTVTFHGDDGSAASRTVELADGAQAVLVDVVSWWGSGGSGWLELESDAAVIASSRTYDDDGQGTYGQYLDGVATTALASVGQVLWLPQLRQDEVFRSNIGLVNGGEAAASLRLRLYDAGGAELASEVVSLDAGARIQLNQPFASLAGHSDLTAGYATLAVEVGEGVLAYASVIDNASNDPTTIPAMH